MKIDEEFRLSGPFNRLNDVYFKYVLASPERKHLTIAFLNAVLNHYVPEGEEAVEIEDVEFLDRETVVHVEDMKGARFDVFARSKDGRLFHIEVQNMKEDFFMQRSFYYAANDYMTQLERGGKYKELKPVIFIGLMNFVLIGNPARPEEWYTLHRLMNAKTHEYSMREVEFHMVEMPLLRSYLRRSNMELKDKFEELLCYFGRIGGKKFMKELAERNPVVGELIEAEKMFRMDPIAYRNYAISERARKDLQDQIVRDNKRHEEIGEKRGEKRGFIKGREEGRVEGRVEGREEMLRVLRSKSSMTDDQIAEMFNMPIELIQGIQP